MITVSDLDAPGLRPYRTLRRPEEHRREGVFVAEGLRVVRRMMDAGLETVSMLGTPEMLRRLDRLPPEDGAPVYVAGRDLLERIAGCRMHQGIMAVGRIPPEPALEDLLDSLPSPILLAALDGLAHAQNVGVLLRNCAAFGVQAVIVGPTTCSPWLRRAVRNSMGAVFQLPILHPADLAAPCAALRARGVSVLGTDPHAATALTRCDLGTDLCIVFGEEDAGISPAVCEQLTLRAGVPMKPGVDSLNVASAAAVVLYEVRRQRTGA